MVLQEKRRRRDGVGAAALWEPRAGRVSLCEVGGRLGFCGPGGPGGEGTGPEAGMERGGGLPAELALTHGVTCISVLRETDTDGQASGGSDSGDWIFTIREKDPKSLENGALQPSDLERNKVRLLVHSD